MLTRIPTNHLLNPIMKAFVFSLYHYLATSKKSTWAIWVLLLSGFVVFGQQEPQYTQYMYNMNVVNPAYAGSKENVAVGLLFRDQWTGIEGHPQTFTFNAHAPLKNGLGVGLSAIADKAGPIKNTTAFADISYTIELENTKLAFGLKAGANFYDIALSSLHTQDPNDPAFSKDYNATKPNFGAGLLYYSDHWYVGFSVPNFIKTSKATAEGYAFGVHKPHWFATAGYVFDVNDHIKLKPSTLVKTAFGSKVSADLNLNALFNDLVEIGASYRWESAVSALAGVRPVSWLQIGFAYDHSINDIKKPSYEAFVLFDIHFKKKKTYRSPRYF